VRYLLPILVLAAVAVALVLQTGERREAPAEPRQATPTPIETATPPPGAGGSPDVRRVRCPEGEPGCRAVRGTVVYVESVDPDGDGDLHVVVDGSSITLPGMTAIDVAPELRPRRDPRVGDRVSAAGPVQVGSYGQDQVHALEFRVRRP
jgi:hypothetical protein